MTLYTVEYFGLEITASFSGRFDSDIYNCYNPDDFDVDIQDWKIANLDKWEYQTGLSSEREDIEQFMFDHANQIYDLVVQEAFKDTYKNDEHI
jgi:hypothetical protein